MKHRIEYVLASILLIVGLSSSDGDCGDKKDPSDIKQHDMQEKLLQEGVAQTGMPAIKNFRERKMLKDILELRDQDGLATYTYLYNEFAGKLQFLGESIGYGIPYATEYTNPQKVTGYDGHEIAIPQADPNALYSPSSAEGTWVLLKNPNGKDVQPVYIESRIIVSPFKLLLN
jgi:hypothetical protein